MECAAEFAVVVPRGNPNWIFELLAAAGGACLACRLASSHGAVAATKAALGALLGALLLFVQWQPLQPMPALCGLLPFASSVLFFALDNRVYRFAARALLPSTVYEAIQEQGVLTSSSPDLADALVKWVPLGWRWHESSLIAKAWGASEHITAACTALAVGLVAVGMLLMWLIRATMASQLASVAAQR